MPFISRKTNETQNNETKEKIIKIYFSYNEKKKDCILWYSVIKMNNIKCFMFLNAALAWHILSLISEVCFLHIMAVCTSIFHVGTCLTVVPLILTLHLSGLYFCITNYFCLLAVLSFQLTFFHQSFFMWHVLCRLLFSWQSVWK